MPALCGRPWLRCCTSRCGARVSRCQYVYVKVCDTHTHEYPYALHAMRALCADRGWGFTNDPARSLADRSHQQAPWHTQNRPVCGGNIMLPHINVVCHTNRLHMWRACHIQAPCIHALPMAAQHHHLGHSRLGYTTRHHTMGVSVTSMFPAMATHNQAILWRC